MKLKKGFLIIYIALFVSTPLLSVYPADINFIKFESAREYFKKGTVYFNNMQYLAAAEFFKKAIQNYPDYYTARDYLARSYRLAGFSSSAVSELNKILEIYPENISARQRLDSILFRKGITEAGENPADYVLHAEYDSSAMKRFAFPDATDIAIDRARNIYVTSFSSPRVIRIDLNGNAEEIIRTGYTGGIYGIDCNNGRIAISDFKNDTVFIYSSAGKVLNKFGSKGSGEGMFHGPKGLCYDKNGYLYIVDGGNYRVQKFDPDGNFNLSFGKNGEYEGEFKNPSDITSIKDRVYVTDTALKKVAVYDLFGNYIKDILMDEITSPRGISSRGDNLVISDENNGIIIFNVETGEKNIFREWGERNLVKAMYSIFDQDGFFYVLDSVPNRIYCFSPAVKQYSNLELEITTVDSANFPVVAYYVNVRGRDGKPVYGLKQNNFTITEDNSRIMNFYTDYLKERVKSASFALAVDRSEEMEKRHGDLPWLADFVLKSMRTNDSIELINFNDQVWTGSGFDWSRRRTIAAIEKKDYRPGKKTGAALYQSITSLIPRADRRGVVLITDGSISPDSFTQYTPDTIIDYAREHYIPVFIISLKPCNTELARIAEETGGKVILPSDIDSLRSIYPSVKNSEEYRYVLVYNTFKLPSFNGWWVDVKLEVNYKGQKGIEWGGYFVP
ncbi:MAG TPA: hypothetical protein PK358_02355 [Spirochaetota bacterium]|nr:hypothetical protein [Spirochaetota bacterium]HPJ33648.1 hypothetical protein [Spirochaetota bacterium]